MKGGPVRGDRRRPRAMVVPTRGQYEAARLDALFRSEGPRLQRYFRRKTGDGEVACDLLQDAFVKMMSAYRNGLRNPAAYLQRVARNLLSDRFRNQQRAVMINEVPLEECEVVSPPRQEEHLAAGDLLKLYEAALAGLSDKTRTVFLLSRAEGLSYEQIRRHLGISMGTVEYHMMRALAHIDRRLAER